MSNKIDVVMMGTIFFILLFFSFAPLALIKLNERETQAIKDKINEIGEENKE